MKPWGDNPDQACRYANGYDKTGEDAFNFNREPHGCDDGYAVTAPVGRFESNAWRLKDMLGNAWEWACSDWDGSYAGEEQKCSGKDYAKGLRALRGGSWDFGPAGVRSAFRTGFRPDFGLNGVGFRLARIK
jgi:formylglycine-generating enzyme required for sulfatase activity